MSAVDRVQGSQGADPNSANQDLPSGPAAPAVSGAGSAESKALKSRRDRMAEHFAKQPKERIRVSRNTFAQINGYAIRIKAGASVLVPKQFAELLIEADRA